MVAAGGEYPFPAQDEDGGAPSITSRSIFVGDVPQSADDDVGWQDGDNHNNNRSVRFGGLNISQRAQDQAYSAANRARARSDEEALAQTVADAGLNTFGCVFVEVWAMSDDGTKLTRPAGGHWMDPAFAQSLPDEESIESAWELDREASDCPPGAGLAGTIAEEVSHTGVNWRQIKSMLNDPFVQR